MHRTPYPTEPTFGWIPPQDAAPRGNHDTRTTSVSNPNDAPEYSVWLETAVAHNGDDQPTYWTPFSGDLPPTIITRRRRHPKIHVSTRVKYPMMVALTVAAISSGSMISNATPAQAAPSDDETTGSFRAIPAPESEGVSDDSGMNYQTVGGGNTYTVQPGDTLRAIAANYGLDTGTLAGLNGIGNPDLILPGQELTISGSSGQGAGSEVVVTVEPGDTVSKLAAQYGVSASVIIDHPANDLANPDLIFPGQQLTIPGGVAQQVSEPAAEPQVESNPEPVVEQVSVESEPEPVVESAPAEAAPPANATGQQIVDLAMSHLGAPYVWGAVGPNSFDCSGFTYYVLNQLGINVARDMESQAAAGVPVSPDNLQPGDIVFQQNTYKAGMSHVGIYIGGGQFINAANPSVGVVVSNLWDDYWGPRFHSARRIT